MRAPIYIDTYNRTLTPFPTATPLMPHPAQTFPLRGRRLLGLLLTAWFGLAALWFGTSTLLYIYGFAWPQPTMDQFRLYPWYLELPFPDNVLQRENGHRPVIPGLVRVAEIHVLQANQKLQIVFGTLCAFLTVVLMAWVGGRERALPVSLRAAVVAFSVMAVFWLGNARMLLHGNELVHAYLLTLSVVVAALATWQARTRPWAGMALASACGVVATFSFGPGLALFPAVIVAGWALRLPWRSLMVPAGVAGLCLVLYLFILPGDDNVRGSLRFSPLDVATTSIRWLASPWINAWLGFATPPLIPGMAESMARRFPLLVDTANLAQRLTGLRWSYGLALMFGTAGLAVMGWALLRARAHRSEWTRLGVLALVLMLFAAATAVLVSIARLDYFARLPDQIFADRYLVWPCLFWLGVFMFLADRSAATRPWLRVALIALAAFVPWFLLPTHQAWSRWGEAVYRANAASAAAVRSDVYDADLLKRDDPSVALSEKLHSLALFRARRLAMFSRPGPQWLGQPAPFEPVADAQTTLQIWRASAVGGDLRDTPQPPAWRVEGVVTPGQGPACRGCELVVLDGSGRVVGFAERSFVAPQTRGFIRALLPKNGFDAWIRAYDPHEQYRLVEASPDFSGGRILGVLHAPAPAAP